MAPQHLSIINVIQNTVRGPFIHEQRQQSTSPSTIPLASFYFCIQHSSIRKKVKLELHIHHRTLKSSFNIRILLEVRSLAAPIICAKKKKKICCCTDFRPLGVTVSLGHRYYNSLIRPAQQSRYTSMDHIKAGQGMAQFRMRSDWQEEIQRVLKLIGIHLGSYRASHPFIFPSIIMFCLGLVVKGLGHCSPGSQCDFAESKREA